MRGVAAGVAGTALAIVCLTAIGAGAQAGGDVEIVIEPSAEKPAAEADAEAVQKTKKAGKDVAKKSKNEDPDETTEQKLARMKSTFAEFCEDWTEKLRERERFNLSKVKWETGPDGGVFGEYVGYDTKAAGAQTVDNVDTTPIGKLVYMEFRLRRSGKSKEEALAQEPEIVDRIEVTEIFRHDRTGWVY